MKTAKTIMIQGTGSGVGKSVITSALCRIFNQDGFNVAPYKAQNMALNSFVTPSGGEIGRAQAAQAQAARVVPTVDMNPVLIKPCSDTMAQIIVLGKPIGNKSAMGYMNNTKKKLFGIVKTSLQKLRNSYDIVVMEGAGSPAEVNLRKKDIVNMSIALASRSPVILVGDIDKGGVMASIVGTLALLNKAERKLVKGIIINKFRGDIRLFEDGVRFLERRTGVKVLGVIPYFRNIRIPEEDSVPLEAKKETPQKTRVGVAIAVIYLPHLSNFTDFDALEAEPGVNLYYVKSPDKLGRPDVIILPGTKNTISDLSWLNSCGLAREIIASAKAGAVLTGICGGYQMLGTKIHDRGHLESRKASAQGLSLLPVITELKKFKHLKQVSGQEISSGIKVEGYEIHHGITTRGKNCAPAFKIYGTNQLDGALLDNGRAWGTYIHGIFDSGPFRAKFLNDIRKRKGLKPVSEVNYDNDAEFDKLADLVRNNIDINAVYKILDV